MIDPSGVQSRNISLSSVNVLGGGTMLLESDKHGISINITNFSIQTGGRVVATRLHLTAKNVEIAQSGLLDLSFKVSFYWLFS